MASRIKFNDAYPDGDVRPETRTSVAIDRITGGVVPGALFEFEVVTDGLFETSILLRNFELWQVGLLGLVLRDMEDGLVPIGFGKSRGLGDVKVEVRSLKVRYISEVPSGDFTSSLYGVGVLVSDEERRDYGFQEEDTVRLSLKGEPVDRGLMGVAVSFGREGIQEVFRKCVERWKAVVEDDFRFPPKETYVLLMRTEHIEFVTKLRAREGGLFGQPWQRGYIFNARWELEFERTGDRFVMRLMGEEGIPNDWRPEEFEVGEEVRISLFGERREGDTAWREPRIPRPIEYPVPQGSGRVRLVAVPYLRKGMVVRMMWKEVEPDGQT